MKNIIEKINWVSVLSVTGTVLGVAGTVISSISQKNIMNDTIKKEIEKALSNKN